MAKVAKSLKRTRSNDIAEALSAMSMSPRSSVRQNRRPGSKQEGVFVNNKSPADAEIDSGDDLFITQKPVPEAVRSRRQHSYNLSPRDREDHENDSSSSSSNDEPRSVKAMMNRKKPSLPKYSFAFLPERRSRKAHFTSRQNTSLHTFTMGGFFKCVRELWQDDNRGDKVSSSLPTVDMEGQYILPLEEEEEWSESEDIKVVEKKRFVASKAKIILQKSKRSVKAHRRKTSNDGQGTLHGRQRKSVHKIQTEESTSRNKAMLLDTKSSDDGGPSHGVQAESMTSDTSIQAPTELPQTKRRLTRGNKILAQRKEREEELGHDSDATVCELLELQESPAYSTLKNRQVSVKVTEPQAEVFHTDDLSQTGQAEDQPDSQSLLQSLPHVVSIINYDIMYNETEVEEKNKLKRDERVGETCSQSQEDPEDLHTATSVNREADDTPSMSEENPLATLISDEMEINEENRREKLLSHTDDDTVRDTSDSKHEEKKRKKKIPTADHVGEEEDGNLEPDVRMEDSLNLLTSQEENSGKEKKKKKRICYEDDEGAEQRQSSAVSEPLNDNADTPRKKKKKKKERKIRNVEEGGEEARLSVMEVENTESSQERLEAICEKKRKKHKKKQQTPDGAQVGEETGEGLSYDATSEESNARSLKKKKKEEKKGESLSEDVAISCMTNQNGKVSAHNTLKTKEGPDIVDFELVSKKKKKKKKKKCETFSRNVSEDTVTQSDDSVSARKKRRTSSFPDADAEEKAAQPHGQQISPRTKFVAAPIVCGVAKPSVSTGAVETESAQIVGSLEESHYVVKRKKKKKSKMLQKDPEQDFEEKIEKCQSVLHGTTNELMLNLSKYASPSLNAPGNSATDGGRDKKKEKKVKTTDDDLLRVKTSLSEASASERIMKDKHKKAKRKLLNPNESYLKHD